MFRKVLQNRLFAIEVRRVVEERQLLPCRAGIWVQSFIRGFLDAPAARESMSDLHGFASVHSARRTVQREIVAWRQSSRPPWRSIP